MFQLIIYTPTEMPTNIALKAFTVLKYCINNAIIPFVFLLNYIFQIIHFNYYRELMPIAQIIWLLVGFLGGLFFAIAFAFAYFFGADKTIYLQLASAIIDALLYSGFCCKWVS